MLQEVPISQGPLTSHLFASPGLLGTALLTWQYPWSAGLRALLSRKLITLSFSFRIAASRIHTCALIYSHDRSEDSVFRREQQRDRNSALGWGSRPKRFLRLRANCSLHSHVSHVFTLRVIYLPCLALTLISSSCIYHFTLDLIINVFTFDNDLFTFDNLTPPFVLLDRANEFVSALMVHPLVRIIDDN